MNNRQEKISGTVADGGAAGGGEKREKKIWPIHRRFVPPEGNDIIKAQELAERDGRGTIIDAIAILNNETGEFFNIEQAVKNGELLSYAPGSCKPLGVPQKNLIVALSEEEVYAAELNAWLDSHFPHVEFRFGTGSKPAPEKVGAGETVSDDDKRIQGTGRTEINNTITHKLKTRRNHALTAVIATAKRSALDAADYQSVWAALVELAESSERPAPILGYAEIEGVKYRAEKAENGVAFFKKDSLRKMMERAAATP